MMNGICRYGVPFKGTSLGNKHGLLTQEEVDALALVKAAMPTTEQSHPGIIPAEEDESWTATEPDY